MDISLILYVLAGIIAGFVASYLLFFRSNIRKVKVITREGNNLRQKLVPLAELERRKREIKILTVERDLLSNALMRLYEAESEGTITKEDREILSRRYSEQIKQIESKLRDAELYVEVGELERLRDELLSLFKSKIENIEARLEEARKRLSPQVRQEQTQEQATKEEQQDIEKVVVRKTKSELPEPERKVNELRNEIMEALSKLEQIETNTEKENE